MLNHFGITPYLIFDGGSLPSKAGTEKDRRERRKEGKRLGQELLKVGKISQAHLELQKSVDVTPEMAQRLIEELKLNNIQYIVAPYEADPQMIYLERMGIIDGILSEDSDLLVFGAKCLITKLDKYGDCIEICRNRFTSCKEISLVGWSDADFRWMAILSGCDYLTGIGGLGLKTAHRMLRKHKTVDRLVKAAQFDGKLKVPAGFLAAFDQAEKTFLYQWVFCPIAKRLVNLTPLAEGLDVADMPFIGEELPAHLAIGVARGDLNPYTKLPVTVTGTAKQNDKPLAPLRRASSNIQTPDSKGSKPIDSFFKPKRTPLAELDPNIFTPSPSQQVLLEQQRNNNGWPAVPTPRSNLQRVSVPSTAPQGLRRAITDPIGARRSVPNPSKRQRLCSDSVVDVSAASDEGVVRSKFFASAVPEPSPSLRPGKNNRRRTTQGFSLYSDDCIDDDATESLDLEEVASQPKKKMRIFSEGFQSSMQSESQSTSASGSTTAESQESDYVLTPATSQGSPEPESVFGAGISTQMKDLRTRFAYKASTLTLSSTPCVAKSALHRRDTKAVAPSPCSLGVISKSLQQTPAEPILPGTPPAADKELELEDSAWSAMEAEVVVAASSPPPMTPSKRRRSSIKGSEDLLVPDSEAESECSPRKPLFNLARFAFTG